MKYLSLFSGIGGLDLAAEWAGFTTVGQCEMADYPTKILEKHWPDVPRWRDIRTLTREDFYERTGLRTVDIVSGGFPCQPFSVAGRQRGKQDERYLWHEMLRVITELKPRCVVGENVPGILRIAAADIVKDLGCAGYSTVLFDFEAAAVGAPHRRERIAFVGYSEHNGPLAEQELRSDEARSGNWWEKESREAQQFAGTSRPHDVRGISRGKARGERFATNSDSKGLQIAGFKPELKKTEPKDRIAVKGGGMLNPMWVEWLMGFPIGWTELSA